MWDTLIRHAQLLTQISGRPGEVPSGLIADGAVAIVGGRIAWVGRDDDLPPTAAAHIERQAGGALLTPGLIDCHTHLVHAGHRADEAELRLSGVSDEAIARAGGGIGSTVAATRAASEEALVAASLPRLTALAADGVTTAEVKSGYGLELATEMKMLAVARRLGPLARVSVRTSFLGAHAVPPELAGHADAYIDLLVKELLPAMARSKLADAVDAYVERLAFSPVQVERVFAAARALGLPVKLHADQRSDQGGAALAARFGALSADHLEYTSPAGVAALASSGTVAVLLPGAFFFLRETQRPPVIALRASGVPMAVATDLNPGTSPLSSLLTAMTMACTLFGLTPAEALAGVTRHAARALGLTDRGALASGLRADLALWNAAHPAELTTRIGHSPLAARYLAGELVDAPTS